MFPGETLRLAEEVHATLLSRSLTLATAESMTAGLVAGALTTVPGASRVFSGGLVTYQQAAKTRLLDVPAELLEEHGPVSEPATRAMAEATLERLDTSLSLAITGYASSGPGVDPDRVGEVHMVLARADQDPLTDRGYFPGDRATVRQQATHAALALVLRALTAPDSG
ncbi:MAG: CinA family protein [Candidatus Thermoplasmatota archaeon]|nr:CinA family protein [Candidatus Thermoplasmatota archaeon]